MDQAARLEARALELMKAGDFGDEAIQVNEAIVALAPRNDKAWTRLGRCRMERRQFDEAIEALRTALSLNPSGTVATNLLNEVRKRRAMAPTAAERATTGFTAREFAVLETHAPAEACEALRPRLELLFDAVNATTVAERVVQARQRQGAAASKLFHANSCHAGDAGYIYAYHHGGRWEPQFHLGWFSPPARPSCMRIGLAFNTAPDGRDRERGDGQEQALRYFERFQQVVASSWRHELARWLDGSGGTIELGANGQPLAATSAGAVERLLASTNAAALGWVFVGRWLFLDRAGDAAILRDRATLVRAIDETFRALVPLWLSTFAATT